MLDGIFIGATRTRDMRNAMIVTLAIYAPTLALLPMSMGNDGLWAALLVLMVVRGITLWRLYPRIERMVSA